MTKFDTLNTPQIQAVKAIKGPLLVLAGAGTGKTKVITSRIAHMIGQGIQPSEIVAVTFTNKAAKEMRERLIALVGKEHVKNLQISTFHSFCVKILRKFAGFCGLGSNFVILDQTDQLDIVRKALRELGITSKLSTAQILQSISRFKNQSINPKDALNQSASLDVSDDYRHLPELYSNYERLLKLNNAIDFDDCIYKTLELMRNFPEVLEKLRGQYSYFLVDEFQDTNQAQLSVIELIATPKNNVCVVGDDDQSIYSWRGALANIIERFEEIFSDSKTIKLEQNYRCPNIVLQAANDVIKNNKQRKEKVLWSADQAQEKIQIFAAVDEEAEARYVADKIVSYLGQGFSPKDICILYRANNQARAFEGALKAWSINYQVFGGSSIFERKEIKDLFGYIRILFNPKDRMALWRIINVPARGFGLKTLEKLDHLSQEAKISPLSFLHSHRDLLALPSATQKNLDHFLSHYHALKEMKPQVPADFSVLTQEIIDRFKLREEIFHTTKDQNTLERKLQLLKELPQVVLHLCEDFFASHDQKNLTPHDYLDLFALNENSISSDKEDLKSKNFVSLMTLHSAKGLEFPIVFLVGAEEDLLPHKNSLTTPHGISEERRLFYVGLTRAKKTVHLSWCRSRSLAGDFVGKKPSRFFAELPQTSILEMNKLPAEPATPTDKKSQLISKIGNLRASLF